MQNIAIVRYKNPKAHGWAGYMEPDDRSWIAFVGIDGRPRLYLSRDPETGAILPDDQTDREAWLKVLRSGSQPGLRIGMAEDGSGWDGGSPLVVGERVFPLGESGGHS